MNTVTGRLAATITTARLQFTTAVPAKIQISVKAVGGSVVKTVSGPNNFLASHDLAFQVSGSYTVTIK